MQFFWKHVQRSESGAAARKIYITSLWRHIQIHTGVFFFFGLFFKNLSPLSESVRSVTEDCGTEKWDDEFWDVKKMELKY